jgi:hypothetical protein
MTEAKKEYKDDDRKDGGESKETKRTEKMKYGKDLAEGDLDEMDLDELLAELDEDARTDAEQEGYEDGMEDEKEDMEDMEDEDIDLEDMSEEDLKSFIEDVIADMVTSGELEAGEEFEVEDEVEDEEEIDVEDETEVDVEGQCRKNGKRYADMLKTMEKVRKLTGWRATGGKSDWNYDGKARTGRRSRLRDERRKRRYGRNEERNRGIEI